MKQLREIKNRWTGALIHSGETNSIAELVADAHAKKISLSGADLSGAVLSGVPFIPNIHHAVLEAATRTEDALNMSTWHTCETTHCRAGWVVTLAGAAGAAMEWCMGTPAAAAIIYMRSDPKLERVPNFYASNDDALADMKRLAELEPVA